MAETVDLTLRRIRDRRNLDDSLFLNIYEKLVTGKSLASIEYTDILRFGIIMSRSSDERVQRLGYRIFLAYGEITDDYEPLYAIAESRELMPLVAAIERLHPELKREDSLAGVFFAAHSMNFVTHNTGNAIYRTREQMELREFNARESEAIVVAPTSYGKSEMLIDKIALDLNRRTCVLVPSRALIAQTRENIIADERIRGSRVKVITHPEAFNRDDRFIAVMTQERLQRLLVDNDDLALDCLLVDEAQNLLVGDTRGVDLSQVILIARSRNRRIAITYYTPFIASPDNLRHIDGRDEAVQMKAVNEHVKIERFIISRPGEPPRLYDQFLNETFELPGETSADEVDAILENGGHRTLVYVNRPKDAQDLAARLTERRAHVNSSPAARQAVEAIADLIDPDYSLIDAIEHGIMFHHSQVPDSLRLYIEELFRNDDSVKSQFLVTTSTLLEGVNTPADRLIMMTGARGISNLSQSAFRNLAGRVGRFREVFAPDRSDLALLQPRIYLIPSSYSRRNWNVDSFLASVANVGVSIEDDVENPLLENAEDTSDRHDALEFLENVEAGATGITGPRVASTEVGRLCFQNGVRDFDIIANEKIIEERVNRHRPGAPIGEVSVLLDTIVSVFLEGIELPDGDDLARVRDTDGARRFYTMFLTWRGRNEPYKRMISHFLSYWSSLSDEYVYVGHRWGEVVYGEGFRKLFVQMKEKTRDEMVNLAVAKIKEEQDFVDFRLLKYVEILYRLGLVARELYFRIKYGTDDEYLIFLLRNGFSPDLARLVKDSYKRLVVVDLRLNQVVVLPRLAEAMRQDGQNAILVYEAQTLANG